MSKRDTYVSKLLKNKADSVIGKQKLSELEEKKGKIQVFVSEFDIDGLQNKREILGTHEEELKKIHSELTLEERNKEVKPRRSFFPSREIQHHPPENGRA